MNRFELRRKPNGVCRRNSGRFPGSGPFPAIGIDLLQSIEFGRKLLDPQIALFTVGGHLVQFGVRERTKDAGDLWTTGIVIDKLFQVHRCALPVGCRRGTQHIAQSQKEQCLVPQLTCWVSAKIGLITAGSIIVGAGREGTVRVIEQSRCWGRRWGGLAGGVGVGAGMLRAATGTAGGSAVTGTRSWQPATTEHRVTSAMRFGRI